MGARKALAFGALPETSVRLEFVSGSSSKFWQLTKLPNDIFLAEWGRIGSKPQAQKEYSPHEARKKIAEKIGKGYLQVNAGWGKSPAEHIATEIKNNKKQKADRKIDFMKELRSIKNED